MMVALFSGLYFPWGVVGCVEIGSLTLVVWGLWEKEEVCLCNKSCLSAVVGVVRVS